MMGYYGTYGLGSGFDGIGAIMMIFVWIFVIWGILALIRGHRGWGHGQCGGSMGGSSALDVLSQRFAKGEIDEKEYKERKKALQED